MHAKQPNTTEIRAPAQHKTVHSAEPKHHLWNPLRRRKEPQHIDRSSTETKHRSKTWRNLAWGGWVEAWALETFSNPPTDLAVGVGVNGRFHASLAPPPQARQRGRRIYINIQPDTIVMSHEYMIAVARVHGRIPLVGCNRHQSAKIMQDSRKSAPQTNTYLTKT